MDNVTAKEMGLLAQKTYETLSQNSIFTLDKKTYTVRATSNQTSGFQGMLLEELDGRNRGRSPVFTRFLRCTEQGERRCQDERASSMGECRITLFSAAITDQRVFFLRKTMGFIWKASRKGRPGMVVQYMPMS